MAVWYECGDGMVQTKMAKSSIDTSVLLCCPGPSLADIEGDLRGPRRLVMGVNTSYPKVVPDMWIGMDDPSCYDRNLFYRPIRKFLRRSKTNTILDGRPAKDFPEAYFIDVEEGCVEEVFQRRAHDVEFLWRKHTLGVALHLLVWLGAKEIHLVGCDMGGDADYWDDRVLPEEKRRYNRALYERQIGFLRIMHAVGLANGVKIVSATPHSPINEFMEYELLQDTLDRTGELAQNEFLHATSCSEDVDLDPDRLTVACVLKSGGCYGREYVMRLWAGVDRHLDDYQFVCLTDMDLDDCPTIQLRDGLNGWWSKLELFRHFQGNTLYLDLDTVVNGDLSEMRDLEGFWMQRDWLHPEEDNSAIMRWDGDYSYIYNRFIEDVPNHMDRHIGDQNFISEVLEDDPKIWQDQMPGLCASYRTSTLEECQEASLICYQSRPRPHETGWTIHPDAPERQGELPATIQGGRPEAKSLEQKAVGAFVEAVDGHQECPDIFDGRGVIIPAGGERLFLNAWVCIHMLRETGCDLPVHIWHLPGEIEPWMRRACDKMEVKLIDAGEVREANPVRKLGGWELKPYAVMCSEFEEVILLDADNVPVRDPEQLFESDEYAETGAIFWPDRYVIPSGRPIWDLCGVEPVDEKAFESGQIVVDKSRCWKALVATMTMNAYSDFWYNHIYGDKDTWHMSWLRTGTPYTLVPHDSKRGLHPGKEDQRCTGIIYQWGLDGKRLFQHRTTMHWGWEDNPEAKMFWGREKCLEYIDELKDIRGEINTCESWPGIEEAKLSVTDLCGATCSTCRQHMVEPKCTMSPKLLREVIIRLEPYCASMIINSTGDYLMLSNYADYNEVLAGIKDQYEDLYLSVITNAGFDGRPEIPADRIVCSLNAVTPEAFRKHVGLQCGLAGVVDNVRSLAGRYRNVELHSLIHPGNPAPRERLLELFGDVPVSIRISDKVDNHGRGATPDERRPCDYLKFLTVDPQMRIKLCNHDFDGQYVLGTVDEPDAAIDALRGRWSEHEGGVFEGLCADCNFNRTGGYEIKYIQGEEKE